MYLRVTIALVVVVLVVADLVILFLFSLSCAAFHLASDSRKQVLHIIVIETIIVHNLVHWHLSLFISCPEQQQQ